MKGKNKLINNKFIIFIYLAIIFQTHHLSNSTKSATDPIIIRSQDSSSKHFVLVHGACHGAWSWYKLLPLLKLLSGSHKVTALDLGASGINPQLFYNVKTISQYFLPLMDFMASLPPHERVILVGHSLGGLAISQAMEMFPEKVAVAVFVTALMPGPLFNISILNKELSSRQGPLLDSRFVYSNGPHSRPIGFEFGPKDLAKRVYQRSPIEDIALAGVLARPVYLYNEYEMAKLKLSTRKYGSVSRVFIMSEEDKLIEKDFQEWMTTKNPPKQVLEIKGSDHMVMLSKPTELFVLLLRIAENYP